MTYEPFHHYVVMHNHVQPDDCQIHCCKPLSHWAEMAEQYLEVRALLSFEQFQFLVVGISWQTVVEPNQMRIKPVIQNEQE